MSIKHRVKDRDHTGKMRPLFRVWKEQVRREYRAPAPFYDTTRNPSWYNRLFSTKPKRKESRQLCRDIVAGRCEPDGAIFPLVNKPCDYRW